MLLCFEGQEKITVDLDLGGNTSMFNKFISNNYIEKNRRATILQESIGAMKPCLRQLIDL
ncbi:hypothetical protein IC582_007586 [Cucumis melo]